MTRDQLHVDLGVVILATVVVGRPVLELSVSVFEQDDHGLC